MDGGAAQQQYASPQQQMPGGHGGYGQQPPLYPEPSPPSLADAVRAFTTGQLAAEDFQQVFATSKVYCPRGDNPGFLAIFEGLKISLRDGSGANEAETQLLLLPFSCGAEGWSHGWHPKYS